MAPRKKISEPAIPFGSDKHRAFLGIDREKDPVRVAELEEQLAAVPEPMPEEHRARKMPVNRYSWPAGKKMTDGWVRQGRN